MSEKFESVVMYGSWLETARKWLDEDDVCRVMVQLMEYGLSGKVPENTNKNMAIIFDMARPNIDANIKKKVDGRKGGRKPGAQPGNENAKKKRITSGLSNADANAYANANADADANANDSGLTPPAASGFAPLEGAALAESDDGVVMDGREWYEEYLRNKRRG